MIYDPIRKKFVLDTPEELVRQKLLSNMLGFLGFPKGLVAVEKELSKANRRRFDIIVFRKNKDQMIPLLLIECKAKLQNLEDAFRQVKGYNETFQAPFISIADGQMVHTYWIYENTLRFVPFLPSYAQLLQIGIRPLSKLGSVDFQVLLS